MVTKVQKWGNSQGLRVARHILEKAKLSIGDEVEVMVRDGMIVIKPAGPQRGKHDLKKLVSQMPKNYNPGEEVWGPAVGKEVW